MVKKSINRLTKSVKAVSPKKAVQAAKSVVKKRSSSAKHLSVYANLANKRKLKKDKQSRERAEYLASLPKHPVKRLLYRLHPKRVAKYWFSKRGAMMLLKITGVTIAVFALLVIGAFAYFRKDLDKIRPGEIAKRVQTTVTKYYDRNGVLLWEDKGTGNYRLVVESDQISQHLKHATVAIEDKDFYNHHGVSISGLMRAALTNARGGQVQGGSTLTQQLVKQVFFAEEAGERSLKGIPRKIKEMILAIEVERMYNKDQILTLYLNESPYGGRRNGVESASQTYFRKSAKDLTLAEAALLAGIPQNPSHFNPYNPAGHKALIARQHTVLDYMAEQGYVTQKEAEEAKKYPILDNIHPQIEQTEGIKAPHFVLMVRSQLEKELGKGVVGKGGLTVKTTLDWRIQEKLEQEVKAFFDSGRPASIGASNSASVIEDVQTGQIVALVGSRDFGYPGFGQDNAADAFIQPGSSVKPFVFAHLFEQKEPTAYGSGSVLADDNIDRIYGAKLNNWDGRFMGPITIRKGLGLSRNVPAVKAMYVAGKGSAQPTVNFIRQIGNSQYCMPEQNGGGYGLSAAIGGCGSRQVGLVNAYGTLARMGVVKHSASVLEVKNNSGEMLKKWKDDGRQALDPQSAYIVNDILADRSVSMLPSQIPGVRASYKTGTSDKGTAPKDLWIASYSPSLAMTIWLGNSDTSTLRSNNSSFALPVVQRVMAYSHTEVYAKEGKWNPNMWYTRPAGIQQVGRELYPSWWNKKQAQATEKMTFDRVSKKKATQCTPDAAREEIEVTKVTDPITKKDVITAPDGYDAKADDDVHNCDDAKPRVGGITVSKNSDGSHVIEVAAINGKFNLATIDISVDGRSVKSGALSAAGGTERATVRVGSGNHTVTVTIRDEAYYTATGSTTLQGTASTSD